MVETMPPTKIQFTATPQTKEPVAASYQSMATKEKRTLCRAETITTRGHSEKQTEGLQHS
jgi:hypothetical protein